jgi:hypothetical protein
MTLIHRDLSPASIANGDGVYVSFTTCEGRAPRLKPMLDSVLAQWPAERVLLTVSATLQLPEFIQHSGIRIVRSPDYGAFKKHSPAYLELAIKRYIVVDDDCVIPPGWFANLIRWSHRLPRHVVCGAGRVWPAVVPMRWANGARFHSSQVSSPARMDIYIGSGTALFDRRFFRESVHPFDDAGFGEPGHTNWVGGDDIWFSAQLNDTTGIYVVPFDREQQLRHPAELDYASSPDCLWLTEKARDFSGWDRALGHFTQRFAAKARTGCEPAQRIGDCRD